MVLERTGCNVLLYWKGREMWAAVERTGCSVMQSKRGLHATHTMERAYCSLDALILQFTGHHTVIQTIMYTDRETDRQTDRQTDTTWSKSCISRKCQTGCTVPASAPRPPLPAPRSTSSSSKIGGDIGPHEECPQWHACVVRVMCVVLVSALQKCAGAPAHLCPNAFLNKSLQVSHCSTRRRAQRYSSSQTCRRRMRSGSKRLNHEPVAKK